MSSADTKRSLTKANDAGEIAKEFEGLSIEEFKKMLIQKFFCVYGRYENYSRKLFFELYHSGKTKDGEPLEGSVVWRKGEVDGEVEEEVLERPDAIKRFTGTLEKGYTRVFKGVTREEVEKETAIHLSKRTALAREKALGIYYKGKSFFRLAEYTIGLYSVEKGYDGALFSGQHQLTEAEARCELAFALAEGYVREGVDAEEINVNPLAGFGVEVKDNKEIEEVQTRPKEGEFNLSWLIHDDDT